MLILAAVAVFIYLVGALGTYLVVEADRTSRPPKNVRIYRYAMASIWVVLVLVAVYRVYKNK